MTNLGLALTAYQQKHDLENRTMAKQMGINPSTLSRLKQGTLPDAEGLAKIILWMTKEPMFKRSAISAAMLAVAAMDLDGAMRTDMRGLEGPPPPRTSRKGIGLSEKERAWREKAAARNAIATDSKD